MRKLLLGLQFLLVITNVFAQLKIHVTSTPTACQRQHGHNMSAINIGSGIINASATGGVTPYLYSISGNNTIPRTQNNGYFPQLYNTTYKVTVTDATGKTSDTSVAIATIYPIIVLAPMTTTYTSGCNTIDGGLVFHPTVGAQPFLYSIDGGTTYSADSVFKNLWRGYYMCDAEDANGCVSFNWYPYINSSNTSCKIYANPSKSYTACGIDSDPISIYVASPSDSGILVSTDSIHFRKPSGWFNPTHNNPYDAYDTLPSRGPGLFKYFLWDAITNERVTEKIAIGYSCILQITPISVDASCGQSDGGLVVTASNGVAPYSYTLDGVNFQSSNTITGLSTGTYTIAVKDATGAIASAIGTVYNKCPILTAQGLNIPCSQTGGTIVASGVKGSKPYQFSIDGTKFQLSGVFNNVAMGKYNVILKDANGFIDSAKIAIYDSCIQATYTKIDDTCNRGVGRIVINVTRNGPLYYYLIARNGYGIGGYYYKDTIPNLYPGNYTIVLYDIHFFKPLDTLQITINNITPILNLGNDTTLCAGRTLLLSPNISGASYVWQDGSKGQTYLVNKAGRYSVTAISNNCTVRDTINVAYLDIGKIFNTKDTTACMGANIVLDAGHPGSNFKWDDSSTGRTRAVLITGKYWVTVSNNRCTVSDTISCNFIAPPSINLPIDTFFCTGSSVQVNAGSGSNVSYLWNNNATSASIKISKPGTYSVVAIANGCSSKDSITVFQKANPTIVLGNDTTLCDRQTLLLNATTINATYLWQDGSVQPTYTVTKNGDYSVKVTSNGCDTTGKIIIKYISAPLVFLGLDTTLCNGFKLLLDASYPMANYLWQDGSTLPLFTITTAGSYKVKVSNQCGSTFDSITVAYTNCACKFYIPSAFSPNNDSKNDLFKPTYSCIFTKYSFKVYSRFGKTIFISEDPSFGWDGYIKGQPQPVGTYVWELRYMDTLTGEAIIKTGTVMLLR